MKKFEILSPAGNLQSVYQAVQNGADAVYLGGKSFGARAFAQNFSYDEISEAIRYAHVYGVKIYVTVNTLVYENEIESLIEHVEKIYKLGADALIMQDVGMITDVRHRFPDIAIHASTQMHNHNDASLYYVYELGAVRAVLAREMDIEQISKLTCSIEKEAFIHGALCICYSGQCLMSALTKGRSGNRGECAQSCRMRYRLDGKKDLRGEYLISPKDIGLFEDISRLIEAGVYCFKIEGRMKPPEYVGHITSVYAKLLDNYNKGKPLEVSNDDIDKLNRLFNRGFTKGHLLGEQGDMLMNPLRPNHRGVPVGRVLALAKGRIRITLAAQLNQGDGIKFEKSDTGFICNRIFLNGKLVGSAQKGEVIELDAKEHCEAGETVVKTTDVKLIKELSFLPDKRKVPIKGLFAAHEGEPLALTLTDPDGRSVTAYGDIVQKSRTSPVSKQEISSSIERLGDTPYVLEKLEDQCGEEIFVAKSSLNALRRDAVQSLTELRTKTCERSVSEDYRKPVKHNENISQPVLHILVRTEEQLNAVNGIAQGDIYVTNKKLYFDYKNQIKNLRLRTDRLAKDPERNEGERLLVTDTGGIYTYRQNNDFVLDYFLNTLNSRTVSYFVSQGARRITLSPELSEENIEAIIDGYVELNDQQPPLEAIIYARHELMAMQHCVISGDSGKDCGKCKDGAHYIEDIAGNRFPVIADENCNNYILNSRYKEADIPRLLRAGIRHFRVELLGEDTDSSVKILRSFQQKLKVL